MFCLSMNPDHLKMIKEIGYIPVGLGKNVFSNEWMRDNTLDNISSKINFTVNIHFIIGFGKIILIKLKIIGSDFVNIENFGPKK